MNIEIDFPETLEDITLWALENAMPYTYASSYFYQIRQENNIHLNSDQVLDQIRAWLTRIAHLEGAVTHRQRKKSGSPPIEYIVFVAGVFVCSMTAKELIAMYLGDCE
jgi:hypothetical protein